MGDNIRKWGCQPITNEEIDSRSLLPGVPGRGGEQTQEVLHSNAVCILHSSQCVQQRLVRRPIRRIATVVDKSNLTSGVDDDSAW